jgi:hypothetical protein
LHRVRNLTIVSLGTTAKILQVDHSTRQTRAEIEEAAAGQS